MTPQDLAKVAAKFGVSKAVARLSLGQEAATDTAAVAVAQPGKRVRQEKPIVLNKLEADWLAVLKVEHPGVVFRGQAKRFRLGSGAWYKPDFTAILNGVETAWECKGPKQMRGVGKGVLALKVAAAAWPEMAFWLVWRERGQWQIQRITA